MSQTLGSSQGTLEERFSHILQPIRDLAKNWDVDIAHFLEEYLEDLEKIEITFDDGATTMNFSEAAMLIQGSAGVYAKKVEYLHSLVYQVLDLVTQKKKQKGKTGDEDDPNNDEDNEDLDADEQFLPLDDIPETEGSYTKEQDNTSNKSVRPVPEMPTRLIPLEESEKGDNSLYNKKGEIMGNHCDFSIDTGYITADGSLLLEMGDKALLAVEGRHVPVLQALAEEEMECCRGDSLILPTADGGDDEVDGVPPLEDFCGDGGDTEEVEVLSSNQKTLNVQRKSQRKRVTFAGPSPRLKTAQDPWLPLDPYEKGKAAEKPLRKKKPFKIPASLDDNTTKKRKKKTDVKTELPPLHEVVEKLFSHRPKFPKNPLKVPEFPEMEDAFWNEYKMREEIKKEEMKMLKKEELEELEMKEENVEEADGVEYPTGPDNNDDDGDEDEIPQLQLDVDLWGDNGVMRRMTGGTDTGYNTSLDDLVMSYEDLVQKHVEKYLASATEYAQITELSRRVSEWEEKIKPRLEEEERHEPFDIHKYGTFIMQQLVRGEKRAFKELVRGKLEYEICRYTLATLQLANVYNVELTIIPDKSGNIMDCLYVTLLSTKRHFENLEEYRAPSLNDT